MERSNVSASDRARFDYILSRVAVLHGQLKSLITTDAERIARAQEFVRQNGAVTSENSSVCNYLAQDGELCTYSGMNV